ncbi:MAG: Nif3-like dinuclear metal center hexameric protein [Actinomycetes bacterium]
MSVGQTALGANSPITVGGILRLLEERYPAALAADWDAVGLVCGDTDATVTRVLFAVDPVAEVIAEAIAVGAELLVTHHPLFLDPVHGVPTSDPKGRLVHQLIRAGVGHFVAHTNADAAPIGVSDALAQTLGLADVRALTAPGEVGRVGRLVEPISLAEFAAKVAAALPATSAGIRVAGDRNRVISRVAVCGGSGRSLLPAVNAQSVDVFVTADLSHHRALDQLEAAGPALIDVSHWASEWPWLQTAAGLLRSDLGVSTVEVLVSHRCTDPWTWQGSTN